LASGRRAPPTWTPRRAITADGIKGTFVDLRGRWGPARCRHGGGAASRLRHRRPANRRSPTSSRRWKETQPFAGIEIVAWKAGEAKFAVSTASGELLANVNRWRMQVGLDRWSEEEMKKAQKTFNVSGRPAAYFDLDGGKQRILGVILTQGERTWFFKMTGPTDTVAKQQGAFEAFLKSVHFE
jgi:hypothetical protein